MATAANCTTLKNGDLSVVLHIPSAMARDAFDGIHPLLHTEVHIDIYELGD